jgi:SAM-dependent methyltransferase
MNTMKFSNSYEDVRRAEAYATLEFPGTYYLAYRDLPKIIYNHVEGKTALDFGCGAGRSTRFLKKLGFKTIGVDIADPMIQKAREREPHGEYQCMKDGDFSSLEKNSYDLVLSVFTFDNIPTKKKKIGLFQGLRNLLKTNGKIINVVSSPAIYIHEWASFSTKDFPENTSAKSGDIVRIVQTDISDARPVVDILWTDASYQTVYTRAGLKLLKSYKPLARKDEHHKWVNEIRIPPWVIYVLKKKL